EHHAIGDFACQFHHSHVGRPYIDGYVARLAAPVHDVELYAIYMMEFAMEGDTLHPEQALHDFDGLAHRFERLFAFDAHLSGERIPPRAEATDDAIGSKVVECQESRGE